MNNINELQNLRKHIQEIDMQLIDLLSKRMDVVGQVARYKAKSNMQIEDKAREEKLEAFWQECAEGKNITEKEVSVFLNTLFEISKERQRMNEKIC